MATAVLLTGCERKESPGSGGQAGSRSDAESTSGPIRVGMAASLTGSEATWGRSSRNGVKMAFAEINKAGGINGRQLQLIVHDTKGTTQEMGLVVTRLIKSDNVVAILGEVASGLTITGALIAQQEGVPMITHAATNPRVTRTGDMIFRVCYTDDFQGFVTAKFARETLKADNAAILYDQALAYSVGLKDEFKKAFTAMGGTITVEQAYTQGDQDFSAQLNTIRASNPAVVFVPGYYTDVGNILLQADRAGIRVPMLGGDGWDSPQLATIAGKAAEGHYYCNHMIAESPDPDLQRFVATYREKHGVIPDAMAALAYDSANVLAEALKRSSSLSGRDLAAAIAQTKDHKGVTGLITIDENRDAKKPAVIVQIRDGAPKFVAEVTPD